MGLIKVCTTELKDRREKNLKSEDSTIVNISKHFILYVVFSDKWKPFTLSKALNKKIDIAYLFLYPTLLLQHLTLFLALADECSANSDRSAFLKQSFFNSWLSYLSSWNPRTHGLSSGTSWLGASKTAFSPQKTVPVGQRKWTNERVSSRTSFRCLLKALFLLFTRYFPLQNCCPFRLDISFISQLSFMLSSSFKPKFSPQRYLSKHGFTGKANRPGRPLWYGREHKQPSHLQGVLPNRQPL